jgi:hypothetical protein
MSECNDVLGNTCGDCKKCDVTGIPAIVYCTCTESDHYAHVLIGRHPACDKFENKEIPLQW